jgi:hypothetical protein
MQSFVKNSLFALWSKNGSPSIKSNLIDHSSARRDIARLEDSSETSFGPNLPINLTGSRYKQEFYEVKKLGKGNNIF